MISSNDEGNPEVRVRLAGTAVAPDLTGEWESFLRESCKGTPLPSCTVNGKLRLRNFGDADAPTSLVKFFFSDDGVSYTQDSFLKQMSTGKISKGGARLITFSYRLPKGNTLSGKQIVAVIDREDTILESNESNNTIPCKVQ